MNSDTLWKSHQQYWESHLIQDVNYLYLLEGPFSTGMPGISAFRSPVVNSDTLWKSHQQYWESHPDPGCQLSVPGGGAILSIGMPGSSFVSIKPSSDVSVLLLFLRKLHSRPSCALSRGHSGFSQQPKASVLLLWTSSAGETLVETSPCLLGANALVGPAVWAQGWDYTLFNRYLLKQSIHNVN